MNLIKTPPPELLRPTLRYMHEHDILMIKGAFYSSQHYEELQNLVTKVSSHFDDEDRLICYLQILEIELTTLKSLFDLFKVLTKNEDKALSVFWVVPEGHTVLMKIGEDFNELYDFDIYVTML